MDMSYLHLIQILLLLILLCGAYHLSAALPFRRCVPVFVLTDTPSGHPVYRFFRRRIQKDHLYAFDKYQIWRYIEKRKNIRLSLGH